MLRYQPCLGSFKYFPDGRTGGPSFVDCLGCRDYGVLHWFKGLAAKVAIGYVYVVLDTILMHMLTIT